MNFINLTNGIEAIPDLPNWSVVRICSTTIEKEDWEYLIGDLDHNLLFFLSQGVDCHIYDFGTRREFSKTISFGVPFIKNVLTHCWLGIHFPPADKLMRAETKSSQHMKRKVNYYRKILRTSEVRLFGHSKRTEHDGDMSYYQEILAIENVCRLGVSEPPEV